MTVWNAAVEKAYGGKRKIEWKEVLAGEKAFRQTGEWLPQATLDACRENLVSISIPDGEIVIGSFVFEYCRSLTSRHTAPITMPAINPIQ